MKGRRMLGRGPAYGLEYSGGMVGKDDGEVEEDKYEDMENDFWM